MLFVGREKETEIYKTYLNEFLQVYKDDASKVNILRWRSHPIS